MEEKVNKSHRCEFCNAKFNRKDSLTRHQNLSCTQRAKESGGSSNKPAYTCHSCKGTFSRKDNLTRHQKKGRCPGTLQNVTEINNSDNQVTDPSAELQIITNNIGVTSRNSTYTCEGCSKSFSREDSFIQHQTKICKLLLDQLKEDNNDKDMNPVPEQNSSKEKPQEIKDELSNGIVASKTCLERNAKVSPPHQQPDKDLANDSTVPSFRCKWCTKSYTRKDLLKRHQKSGNCQRTFDQSEETESDTDSIEEIPFDGQGLNTKTSKHFMCVLCKMKFTTKTSLNRHVKESCPHRRDVKASDGEPAFICEWCKGIFARMYSLIRHQTNTCSPALHELEDGQNYRVKVKGKYKCDVCQKFFQDKYSLDRHQNSCKVLRKLYSSGKIMPALRKKLKRYKCKKCGAKLWSKDYLKYHMTTDKCKQKAAKIRLEKTWRSRENGEEVESNTENEETLKRSFNIKSSEQIPNYICDICATTFQRSSSLHRHKRLKRCVRNLQRIQQEMNWLKCTTADERIQLVCQNCGTHFKRQDSLFRHKKLNACKNKPQQTPRSHQDNDSSPVLDVESDAQILSNITPDAEESSHNQMQTNFDLNKSKISLDENSTENVVMEALEMKFPCRWCYGSYSSQVEMLSHMKKIHHKDIPNGSLKLADDQIQTILMTSPKTFSCYICLNKFKCAYPLLMCIRKCEHGIGVTTEGYKHSRLR